MSSDENDVKFELDFTEPSQEVLEYGRKRVGENPDTRSQVISDFRDLIYERGACTPHRTDDDYLLRFLRARNFKVESAHKLIVNYYEFKRNNPQFYEDVNLLWLMQMGEDGIISVPPYKEQTGRRLLIYRLGEWDPECWTVDEIFQATISILEIAIIEPAAQIMGGICLFDLGGLSLQQAWYMTPGIASKMVQIMVTSNPMKIHAIHIVNQSWVFDMVYNFFKSLLNDAMKERIFFHGDNMDSLHQHIEPKYLPERYGGIHPDYDMNKWLMFFKQSEKVRTELERAGYKTTEEDELKG